MPPEGIIRQLREHYLKRIIARNRLLYFRPEERGFRRIDICSFFKNSFFKKTDSQQRFVNNASDFFNALMTEHKARIQGGDFSARLLKMQKEANEQARATGVGSVILGWPLVNIPQQDRSSICAPLFFWEVKITQEQRGFLIALKSENIRPEANFALKAWWNHYRNPKTKSWDFDEEEISSFSSIKQKVTETAKSLECHLNDNKQDSKNAVIGRYAPEAKDCFLSCATLGIANFKGQSMLKELENLANLYQSGAPENNLLSDILSQPAETTRSPKEAHSPSESERYLVAEADPSQEKCVWQAREKETKVLFLKGPPGTGKSETIVNLIADAVRHGKFVVVVCHKQTAIDVLQKRMGDKRMGGLVVKTTEPRNDSNKVIQGIKKTEPMVFWDPLASIKRKSCANDMQVAEDKCTRYAKVISHKDVLHSVKGHFRAKIENVSESSDCGKFKHFRHSRLIDGLREIAEKALDNPEEQKLQISSVQEYARSYQQCDFSNNPWKESKEKNIDINSLTELWKDTLGCAQQAQRDVDCLPNSAILEFMANDIALRHISQFVAQERRAAMENFAILVSQTRDAFAMAYLPTNPLWKKVRNHQAAPSYQKHFDNIRHISQIVELHKAHKENKIIGLFHDSFGNKYIANWHRILEAIFCKIALDAITEKIGEIETGFDSQKFTQNIEKIKELKGNKKHFDIQSVLQSQDSCKKEINILEREKDLLRLRGRGKKTKTSLRRLYHNGMGELRRIVPVLMTNPDSLCQLLPLKPGIIDLAIIDEASQMFTADALPILFRAKKIVVSGDDMQMPPDDLFALGETSDEEEQGENENNEPPPSKAGAPAEGRFEILEVVDHLLMHDSPARCELEVHYRSRPAELIAFSNHAFYEGKLQMAADNGVLPTFMQTPIQMIDAAGKFSNGINEIEANEVISLLNKIWGQESPPSVGVIVCNIKQADYLKQRLAEECDKDEDFREKHQLASSQTEGSEDVSFFVRSIQHVQGDERDIIIFATTYGSEARRYGPISTKEKGRRRLNVAVTRAKLGMFVMTSLDIDKISHKGERPDDTSENNNNSAERWYLWQYLKYARAVSDKITREAVSVLRELNTKYKPHPIGKEPDSEFEIQVGDFLRSKDFHVDYQVGEGGFRIDLGVKKNKNARYLCGIECDGRTWHSSWQARQNDIWRQGILEDKGWKIYRIWSDHWFGNKEKAQEELINHLDQLQKDAVTAEN